MASLLEDIGIQSEWITRIFAAEKLKLDFTVNSFITIDKFFNKKDKTGKTVRSGRLNQNRGAIIFSLGAYVGQTFIKNIPGAVWLTDDNDPQGEMTVCVKFPDGTTVRPMHMVMKRFQKGPEDSLYVRGHHLTKDYTNEPFIEACWEIAIEENYSTAKSWWNFW